MPFIIVIADFPDLKPGDLSDIFNNLEKENWIKMHHHSGLIYTVWSNSGFPGQPDEAIKMARHSFYSCCVPHCIPRIVVEWDPKDQPCYFTM
jgi:hypothetical protein